MPRAPYQHRAQVIPDNTTYGADVAETMRQRTKSGTHLTAAKNGFGLGEKQQGGGRKRARSISPVRQPEKKVRKATEKSSGNGYAGTAYGPKKRKASVLQDETEPSKRARNAKTEGGAHVLKEKSTNDDVGGSVRRGHLIQGRKARNLHRLPPSPTPSPSPSPAKPSVSVAKMTGGEAEKLRPKSDGGKKSANGLDKNAVGIARPVDKGQKRKASSSDGDEDAPEPKKVKTSSEDGESPGDGTEGSVDKKSNSEAAEKKASRSDGKKDSAGKTPAPDDDREEGEVSEDELEDGEIRENDGDGDDSNEAAPPPGEPVTGIFKGIKNIKNSCFSSAVIQLIDAALEGRDLDRLLGELEKTADFGISEEECKMIEVKVETAGNHKLARKVMEARLQVMAAARSKNWKAISLAKHLRKLLHDLHDEENGQDAISAFHFQAVMSEGAPNDRVRLSMNGDTQQDCSEYFTSTMAAIENDKMMEDPDGLNRLFNIQTDTTSRCPRMGCGHISKPRSANSNHHVLPVEQNAKISELFESSKHSPTDKTCPKCGKSKLINSTQFKKTPLNFVIAMNRLTYNNRRGAKKDMHQIDLEAHELKIGGEMYQLSAAIMHRGPSPNAGHYIIFRKRGEDWYKVDDKEVSKVDVKQVRDSHHHGQSAMLLFRRQR